MSGVAYVYRWRVKRGLESQCESAWAEITKMMCERFGSGGSCLHRAEDGTYVAYARWKSRAHRDESFAATADSEIRRSFRASIEVDFDVMILDVVDDLLVEDR